MTAFSLVIMRKIAKKCKDNVNTERNSVMLPNAKRKRKKEKKSTLIKDLQIETEYQKKS